MIAATGHRFRSVLTNLLILVVSTGIALLLAEAVVRLAAPQPVQPRFMIDSGFGNRVPAPNKTYHHTVPGDYAVTIHTNGFGGRGQHTYPENKSAGVSRICMLGDSFTFGYGVSDSEVVSSVLESHLNTRIQGGGPFEVVNFGVSGYGQAEQLNLYLNRVVNYQCDDVFVFYFNNDSGNNVVSSLYAIDGTGQLVRDRDEYLPGVGVQERLYGIPIIGTWIAHSHLWSLVRNKLSAAMHRRMLDEQGLEGYSKINPRAKGLTVALLNELEREITQRGSRFFVFVIPGAGLTSNFPFDHLTTFEDITIDGRQVLTREHYYQRDGHWNASGHERAAQAILSRYESDWGSP